MWLVMQLVKHHKYFMEVLWVQQSIDQLKQVKKLQSVAMQLSAGKCLYCTIACHFRILSYLIRCSLYSSLWTKYQISCLSAAKLLFQLYPFLYNHVYHILELSLVEVYQILQLLNLHKRVIIQSRLWMYAHVYMFIAILTICYRDCHIHILVMECNQ